MRIGKITENALKRSILKKIRTEYKDMKSAAVGSDCAFSDDGRCFSTVCPVTADISDGAYYAVVKAINALVAQGVRPDHFTLAILLPADAQEVLLKSIVGDAIEAGRYLDVLYAGGHTEVTTAVTRPVITANAVGYSDAVPAVPQAGQALVVAGWIALEGTAILAHEKRSDLVTRYPVPMARFPVPGPGRIFLNWLRKDSCRKIRKSLLN